MSKITVKGTREPILVSKEIANEIKSIWIDAKIPDTRKVVIGASMIQKGDIKGIFDEEEQAMMSGRNIDEQETRREVIEFGKIIKSLEGSLIEKEISYYGYPLKSEGYVTNDVLGGVHWSVVAYAEREKIIKKSGEYWSVVGIKNDGNIILDGRYKTLVDNLKMLRELKNRIDFAKGKSLESLK